MICDSNRSVNFFFSNYGNRVNHVVLRTYSENKRVLILNTGKTWIPPPCFCFRDIRGMFSVDMKFSVMRSGRPAPQSTCRNVMNERQRNGLKRRGDLSRRDDDNDDICRGGPRGGVWLHVLHTRSSSTGQVRLKHRPTNRRPAPGPVSWRNVILIGVEETRRGFG